MVLVRLGGLEIDDKKRQTKKKVDIYFIRSSGCDKLVRELGVVTAFGSLIVLEEFISTVEGPCRRSCIPRCNCLRGDRTNP